MAAEPWLPSRFTPPLSDDFKSDADWLIPLVELVWILPSGRPLVLDAWQRWLLRHMLELRPDGTLRYRQVFVSVGRQNGKSVLGAVLALYGLVREAGALVIGVASSAEQARIVYTRLLAVLRAHPAMAARFRKITDTRGILSTDGSRYELKASKSAAVQGLDVSLGLLDELHITKRELWSDLVSGTAARPGGLVAGLTTAGDDDSLLLKDLYARAEAGGGDRFGYFVWEAPEARVPEDDATLGRWLIMANPALAEGRLDLATTISDVRSLPDIDIIRYRLNRFVSGTDHALMPLALWHRRATGAEWPAGATITFGLDRSPGWEYAAVTAAAKAPDGSLHTCLVASVVAPTPETLTDLCSELATANAGARFALDGYTLGAVGKALKGKGYTVFQASLSEVTGASSLLYAATAQGRLHHPGDPLLTVQMPATRRKTAGDGFKISRADSDANIDAVVATALAVYFADTNTQTLPTLYVA